MASTSGPEFSYIWRDRDIRSKILSNLDTASKCALRLTSTECCDHTTESLFRRTRLTFTPSALSRPSRVESLSRIGEYIESLTFQFPHSAETFLPPLLNPITGREVNFLYTPHTTAQILQQRPKYGTPELGDLLTQQYPPLFHAATNVAAFIKTFSQMPYLRHLTIACPGQDPSQRYRRDIVDYALISLRIAIERAPLYRLSKLTLHKIHPSGIQYLRHLPGWGCTPSAGRRWRQIRKLKITMDSWEFGSTGSDHLKILEDYIRGFSANLERVSFGWNGRKGPCPFTLFSDPLFSPPRQESKLFCEVTSPMSPLPAAPRRKAMSFPKLHYLQVRNATMSAEQVSDLVGKHCNTVREFDFENVFLINGGLWEDALAPLSRMESDAEWSSQQSGSEVESFLSSYASNDDFDQFMRQAIDEVVDDSVEIEGEIESDIPIAFEATREVRDSVNVSKAHKKKRVRRRKRKHNHPKTPAASALHISDPIPIPMPLSLKISDPISIQKIAEPTPILLQPTTFNPGLDPNVQGVQRNLAQDTAMKELVDDPDKRVSALKKAREAVLSKLGKEFLRGGSRPGLYKNTCSSVAGRMGHRSNSALVPLMFSR